MIKFDLQAVFYWLKMYKDYSDSALVELWKGDEDAAFDEIYARYLVRLVNMARLKTGDAETAKELVQDVFMALFFK